MTRNIHIKEGLVRFFCLIPFDVITLEVWNKAMAHWMEAINQEVSRDALQELSNNYSEAEFIPELCEMFSKALVLSAEKNFEITNPTFETTFMASSLRGNLPKLYCGIYWGKFLKFNKSDMF